MNSSSENRTIKAMLALHEASALLPAKSWDEFIESKREQIQEIQRQITRAITEKIKKNVKNNSGLYRRELQKQELLVKKKFAELSREQRAQLIRAIFLGSSQSKVLDVKPVQMRQSQGEVSQQERRIIPRVEVALSLIIDPSTASDTVRADRTHILLQALLGLAKGGNVFEMESSSFLVETLSMTISLILAGAMGTRVLRFELSQNDEVTPELLYEKIQQILLNVITTEGDGTFQFVGGHAVQELERMHAESRELPTHLSIIDDRIPPLAGAYFINKKQIHMYKGHLQALTASFDYPEPQILKASLIGIEEMK